MPLSKEQVASLIGMVASGEPDELDCDGCFEQLAVFAETQLTSREIPEALLAIETHLQQCACCQDEFNALMEGLRALEEA